MAKLLHIAASPRVDNSYSRRIADGFVQAYREMTPNNEVETLDLWQTDLPSFDGAMLAAKYAVMQQADHSSDEAAAWARVRAAIDHFASADCYVISTPMWNFGIPYPLKHYIDIIAQPGLSFGFDPERGYFGLLKNKAAIIVCARGGQYPKGSEAADIDFQLPYLRHMMNFVGIDDVHEVLIEGTVLPEMPDLSEPMARARELAAAMGSKAAAA